MRDPPRLRLNRAHAETSLERGRARLRVGPLMPGRAMSIRLRRSESSEDSYKKCVGQKKRAAGDSRHAPLVLNEIPADFLELRGARVLGVAVDPLGERAVWNAGRARNLLALTPRRLELLDYFFIGHAPIFIRLRVMSQAP
jgi:hypothetical protein